MPLILCWWTATPPSHVLRFHYLCNGLPSRKDEVSRPATYTLSWLDDLASHRFIVYITLTCSPENSDQHQKIIDNPRRGPR